ncbi:hypothetical protein D3227_26275 [Mesorhizobium waimense]|uniref:Uncharacterized protein n=1 Tax=Mesorhizobium waimense TaxID=1300307 RepID=A0A3A5KJB9_9HYPH|nr:hypothetical protein [Mesorhizobium waimense]RJT32696.1 hypothetical protein D3227_26275 [Mesorhizobium waimense]
MSVQCRVSVDDSQYIQDVTFQVLPRIGETVSMAIGGSAANLRVSRVVHLPEGESPDGSLIVVELTSKIL